MPEPTVPDLRTAAQIVATTWDATWGKVSVTTLENTMGPLIDTLRRAALAAEATEPPPTPEWLYEVIADALTESGGSHVLGSDVARARNAVLALLTSGPAPDPQGAGERPTVGGYPSSGRHASDLAPPPRGPAPVAAPDEPTDDDLAERLRHASTIGGYLEAHERGELLDLIRGAFAEVERLRAAAAPNEDGGT